MYLRLLFIILFSCLVYALPVRSDDTCSVPRKNRECIISQKILTDWIRSDTLPTVIDLRGDSTYRNLSAQNAIALTPSAVKGKKHVHDKPTLLLDEPYALRQPLQLCQSLRALGNPNVFVLDEGLYSWKQAGGKFQGLLKSLPQIRKISPRDLIIESSYTPWAVLHLRSQAEKALKSLLPPGTTIETVDLSPQTDRDTQLLTDTLANAIRSIRKRQIRVPIAIVSSLPNEAEHNLHKALQSLYRTKKLFLLDGGSQGLRDFVKKQALIVSSYLKQQMGPQCKKRR
ncbi:MAG: rhodanese-like domain-containing protein [Bdellovibrionales bacterium]|nr:rhodanese-like domain-containing protein [Bdellovibrionales bacterium]